MSRSFVVNALVGAVLVLLVATVVGLVSLWPGDRTIDAPAQLIRPTTEAGHVVAVAEAVCRTPGARDCRRITVELESGRDEGRRVQLTLGDGGRVQVEVGDDVRLFENRLPPEAQLGGVKVDPYSLADFERRVPLLWLTVAFAALVGVTGRWRGLRALLGLAGSLAIVLLFVVPAILEGRDAVAVALIGALAVMFVTLPLAHGIGVKTIAASLGTFAALVLTVTLASLFAGLAHLSGLSSDEAIFLQTTQDISLRGLLLAGVVIAALGVLDDLTVSQASTVIALRNANPALRFRELFRGALAVGHDHIAATVNTLVLAYAGASLPVLLIFSIGDVGPLEAVNNESVASQVVATLVGSIGLIAAVPVTTALAALLATRIEAERLRAVAGHEHLH